MDPPVPPARHVSDVSGETRDNSTTADGCSAVEGLRLQARDALSLVYDKEIIVEETPEVATTTTRTDQENEMLKGAAAEFLRTETEHIESLKKMGKVFPGYLRDSAHVSAKDLSELENFVILTIEKHMLSILPTHEAIKERFLKSLEIWDPNNPRMADILLEFTPMLKCIKHFLKDKADITNKLLMCRQEDMTFKTFCEQYEKVAFLGRPLTKQMDCVHQRVMEYAYLLENYAKHLVPDTEEYKKTQVAIRSINTVAKELDKLLVDSFTFDDMKKLEKRLQGVFNIFQPGTKLRKHGPIMKQSRKEIQARYLILFSDRMLYCHAVRNDKLEISLTFEMDPFYSNVFPEEHEDFDTEFIFQGKDRSLIFITKDKQERDSWVESIRNALEDAQQTTMDALAGAKQISENFGWCAPALKPNDLVTMCQIEECSGKFTTTRRRHHCKCCGNVICSDCCGRAPLYYSQFRHADRVCCECYFGILGKRGFFDKELKNFGFKTRFDLKPKFKPPKNRWTRRKKSLPKKISVTQYDEGCVTGYLNKFDEKKNEWKRFWAKLPNDTNILELYLAPNDNVFKEKIVLYNAELKLSTEEDENSISTMEIFQKNQDGLKNLRCTFKANTQDSAKKWEIALRQVCSMTDSE